LGQFLHNVAEYAYTEKETKEEEDHKYYHPWPQAIQVRSLTNFGDDTSPCSVLDAGSISHKSSSWGLNSTDPGEIDAEHNPEDKAKDQRESIKIEIHVLCGLGALKDDKYKINEANEGTESTKPCQGQDVSVNSQYTSSKTR